MQRPVSGLDLRRGLGELRVSQRRFDFGRRPAGSRRSRGAARHAWIRAVVEGKQQRAAGAQNAADLAQPVLEARPEVERVDAEDLVEGASGGRGAPRCVRPRSRRVRAAIPARLSRRATLRITADGSRRPRAPAATRRATSRSVRPCPQPISRTRSPERGARSASTRAFTRAVSRAITRATTCPTRPGGMGRLASDRFRLQRRGCSGARRH